jgi:hypothetical protein
LLVSLLVFCDASERYRLGIYYIYIKYGSSPGHQTWFSAYAECGLFGKKWLEIRLLA